MGFLDKLKPQPRWKHADASVRLEAVKELDDQDELGLIAESDSDVRVRRAAIARLTDPAILGRVQSVEPDAEARDRAADRLMGFAMRGDRGSAPEVAEPVALAAVRQIADVRRLSTVAKSDAPDAVRTEALARLSEQRALGSVARQARHESTAAAALERLTDRSELIEVALNSTHAGVATSAFDRLFAAGLDVAELRMLEGHGHQKAVTRKAKALIQEHEEAETARLAAIEERRRRESACCDAMEQVASLTDLSAAGSELARLTGVWAELDVQDPGLLERFARAQSAAETSIARREREAAEAADLRRRRAEAIATRDALCVRVETLDGDDVLEQLIPIEEEWRSLLPLVGSGPEADRLAERFAQAVAACRKRHEMGALLAETRSSLEALVIEAERLPDDDAAALRWHALGREARGLTATLRDAGRNADDLTARLAVVGDRFAVREQTRQAAVEAAAAQARQELLNQFRHLTERARRAVEADTITLREGERLMRDVTAGFDLANKAPSSSEVDEAVSKLRTLQEQLAPRVRELREMDEWRRFANAQRQEQLIAMAEAIVASLKSEEEAGKDSDLAATARALRELNAKWQEVAEAPRQNAQRLWDRFRAATDIIRSRCEVHFVRLREERAAILEKKTEIVAEAESLAESNDWAKTAARLQELQLQWQSLGPVSRDANRELSQRFRAACSTFFARRRDDMTDRKRVWGDNLARKEALCERAEALAESMTWEETAAELKRLQAEWKTIGPVRRNKSEQVWNRFRSAADRFFTRYHNRHELMLAAKLAEREAFVVEIEQLASGESADATALAGRVQELRTTWNRAVPIPSPEMKTLTERWNAALARLVVSNPDVFSGTDLDPAAVARRMEKLVARVEGLLNEVPAPSEALSPTELLAAKLRSALASNAMGSRGAEEAKGRAAVEAVRDAQAAWQRLPAVDTPEVRALASRFRDACRRVLDQPRRGPSGSGGSGAPRGRRTEEPEAVVV